MGLYNMNILCSKNTFFYHLTQLCNICYFAVIDMCQRTTREYYGDIIVFFI